MEGVKSGSERPPTQFSAPVPLSSDHGLSDFDCGEPTLNDWLKLRALKNESRFSRTYVVCDENEVVAYVCISAGGVERSEAPRRMRQNAPDRIPVSIIGRLAVSRRHAGEGLGASMLAHAFRGIALASQSVGIAAVIVHCKNNDAKRFYLACAEFIEYPENSDILFLPIETLLAALR